MGEFDLGLYSGLWAPAGTPAPIVQKLNAEVNQILAAPDVKSTLVGQGTEVLILSQPEFADKLRKEIAMWQKIVKITGAKPE